MKYQYTELPVYVEKNLYHDAIQRMAGLLVEKDFVKTVFQVGGVSHPGISDIDLYVVFHENAKIIWNPVSGLSFPDNYLFTHRLFGTTAARAAELEKFTFFGNYNYVAGSNEKLIHYHHNDEDTRMIKRQIAMEYLLKAWITISNNIYLKKIKVRSFLLLAKAIQYDLDFLGEGNAALRNCISEIIELRNHWFEETTDWDRLEEIVDHYYMLLEKTILDEIMKVPFYLHPGANLQISKRIKLKPSMDLKMQQQSIPLIRYIPYVKKLEEKLTYFEANVPVSRSAIPNILVKRHEVLSEAFEYNSRHLPGFIFTGHGLNIFKMLDPDGEN